MGTKGPEGRVYQRHKVNTAAVTHTLYRLQVIDYKALIDEECVSVGNDITQLFVGELGCLFNFHIHNH